MHPAGVISAALYSAANWAIAARQISMAPALLATGLVINPLLQTDTYQAARKLLDAVALRQEALAMNIANVETPGYRRVDVSGDFATQIRAQLSAGKASASLDMLAPRLAEDPLARAVRPDGNTVEIERELLAMNRNAVEHEFLADVVSNNLKQLKLAITGRSLG